MFGVRDLIVSDVKFHEGSEFGEVFESVDDVIFQRKLEKIMQSGNVLDSGYFVLTQFHLLEVNQSIELLYLCDQVIFEVQFFQQFA